MLFLGPNEQQNELVASSRNTDAWSIPSVPSRRTGPLQKQPIKPVCSPSSSALRLGLHHLQKQLHHRHRPTSVPELAAGDQTLAPR
jgi:hypothetical protein